MLLTGLCVVHPTSKPVKIKPVMIRVVDFIIGVGNEVIICIVYVKSLPVCKFLGYVIYSTGCRKRLFSLALEKPYSGLRLSTDMSILISLFYRQQPRSVFCGQHLAGFIQFYMRHTNGIHHIASYHIKFVGPFCND